MTTTILKNIKQIFNIQSNKITTSATPAWKGRNISLRFKDPSKVRLSHNPVPIVLNGMKYGHVS